jgi:hypothetical protein
MRDSIINSLGLMGFLVFITITQLHPFCERNLHHPRSRPFVR